MKITRINKARNNLIKLALSPIKKEIIIEINNNKQNLLFFFMKLVKMIKEKQKYQCPILSSSPINPDNLPRYEEENPKVLWPKKISKTRSSETMININVHKLIIAFLYRKSLYEKK